MNLEMNAYGDQDVIDRYELYEYIGKLSAEDQYTIRDMIDRMNVIVSESPRNGHVALGALVLELTGISVTDIKGKTRQ